MQVSWFFYFSNRENKLKEGWVISHVQPLQNQTTDIKNVKYQPYTDLLQEILLAQRYNLAGIYASKNFRSCRHREISLPLWSSFGWLVGWFYFLKFSLSVNSKPWQSKTYLLVFYELTTKKSFMQKTMNKSGSHLDMCLFKQEAFLHINLILSVSTAGDKCFGLYIGSYWHSNNCQWLLFQKVKHSQCYLDFL